MHAYLHQFPRETTCNAHIKYSKIHVYQQKNSPHPQVISSLCPGVRTASDLNRLRVHAFSSSNKYTVIITDVAILSQLQRHSWKKIQQPSWMFDSLFFNIDVICVTPTAKSYSGCWGCCQVSLIRLLWHYTTQIIYKSMEIGYLHRWYFNRHPAVSVGLSFNTSWLGQNSCCSFGR